MKLTILAKTSLKAFAISALMIGAFTACESQVVDLTPVDQFTDDTAYDTPNRCELSVVGVYEAARSGKYTNGSDEKRGYPFGGASIEQSEMRGEDMVNTDQFFDYTYETNYGFTTLNNTNMWFGSFTAINRANIVIAGIEKAIEGKILTKEEGEAYIGECLYLRAMIYHNLMVHFAYPLGISLNNNYGMPYYTKASNSPESMAENLKIGRSTVAETYDLILADLTRAETLLADGHKTNKITRATKGSAIAMKTRVYLHMRQYDKVVAEAKKLAPQASAPFSSPVGGYSLTTTPEVPFTAYSNNSESIFSIEFSDSDPGASNGGLATMMSCREGGRHLMCTSPIVYNSKFWTKDDKRRALHIEFAGDKVVYCDKYQDPVKNSAYAPMIRYAEVLLNYAEACYRTGDRNTALVLLNAVRDRSLGEGTPSYTLANLEGKALLEAILWERRIEFAGEGRRWEDIHRLVNDPEFGTGGIPAKIGYSSISNNKSFGYGIPVEAEWYRFKAISYDNFRFLWPIPIEDTQVNLTLGAQQNAGWK